MLFAISRSFKLVLAPLMVLATVVGQAQANEGRVVIESIQNPDLVKIQPLTVDGQNVDLIKVGTLPAFSVRADLPDSSFTEAEKESLSKIRRDILAKTVNGLIAGATEMPMLISDDSIIKSATVTSKSSQDSFKSAVLAKPSDGDSVAEIKKRKTLREKAAAVIAFLNENILKSTYRAGKDFVRDSKGTRGFREFGFSVVLRGELQIGAGKTNIMKTVSRGLDIGYDIKSKELVIRTIVRHEKMEGGTAMALGPKMELRAYRANLDEQEHASREGHVHGKTWYPPAPPLLTFASESFPGYHSIGTALAFNVFDIVVPTYLFNTVNEFDADYNVKRVSLSPLSYVKLTVAAVKRWITGQRSTNNLPAVLVKSGASAGPSANQCQAIFKRAS